MVTRVKAAKAVKTAKKSAKSSKKVAKTPVKKVVAKTAKKAVKAKRASNGLPRPGSKNEMLYNMLTSKNGTTYTEIVERTGWPSVSVPGFAAQYGLELTRTKTDGSEGRVHFVYKAKPKSSARAAA